MKIWKNSMKTQGLPCICDALTMKKMVAIIVGVFNVQNLLVTMAGKYFKNIYFLSLMSQKIRRVHFPSHSILALAFILLFTCSHSSFLMLPWPNGYGVCLLS